MNNKLPKINDLLTGGKVIGSEGVKEWFDFPRYRVVAFHVNLKIMFVETLGPKGEVIGYNYFNTKFNEDYLDKEEQWKFFKDEE